MTELLSYLARALADHSEEVRVESFEEEDGTTVLELSVAGEALGKVIGGRGRPVGALGAVMGAAATRHGGRVLVDVVD